MPSDKPRFPVRLTSAQKAALPALVRHAGCRSKSEFVLLLCAEYARRHGLKWEDDMPHWGEKSGGDTAGSEE